MKGAYGNTKAEPGIVIIGNADSPVAIIKVEVTRREDR